MPSSLWMLYLILSYFSNALPAHSHLIRIVRVNPSLDFLYDMFPRSCLHIQNWSPEFFVRDFSDPCWPSFPSTSNFCTTSYYSSVGFSGLLARSFQCHPTSELCTGFSDFLAVHSQLNRIVRVNLSLDVLYEIFPRSYVLLQRWCPNFVWDFSDTCQLIQTQIHINIVKFNIQIQIQMNISDRPTQTPHPQNLCTGCFASLRTHSNALIPLKFL